MIIASLFFQTLFLFGVKKSKGVESDVKKFLSVRVFTKSLKKINKKIQEVAYKTRTDEKRKKHKGYAKTAGDFACKALETDNNTKIFKNALLYFVAREKGNKLESAKSIRNLKNKDRAIWDIITENWVPGNFDASKKSDEVEEVACDGRVAFTCDLNEEGKEFVWKCGDEAIEVRVEDEPSSQREQVLPDGKRKYSKNMLIKRGKKKVQKQKRDSAQKSNRVVETPEKNDEQSEPAQMVVSTSLSPIPLPPVFLELERNIEQLQPQAIPFYFLLLNDSEEIMGAFPLAPPLEEWDLF